jgi:hypothetical protein
MHRLGINPVRRVAIATARIDRAPAIRRDSIYTYQNAMQKIVGKKWYTFNCDVLVPK